MCADRHMTSAAGKGASGRCRTASLESSNQTKPKPGGLRATQTPFSTPDNEHPSRTEGHAIAALASRDTSRAGCDLMHGLLCVDDKFWRDQMPGDGGQNIIDRLTMAKRGQKTVGEGLTRRVHKLAEGILERSAGVSDVREPGMLRRERLPQLLKKSRRSRSSARSGRFPTKTCMFCRRGRGR